MDIFDKKILELFLPETFKGLNKKYIIDSIFNKKIQKQWLPSVGDIIVGKTGNVFVISGKHELCKELGGTLFFFGGGLCNRDGGCMLNETYCYTMNANGFWYEIGTSKKNNPYHCALSEFRFVPYPHEKKLILSN